MKKPAGMLAHTARQSTSPDNRQDLQAELEQVVQNIEILQRQHNNIRPTLKNLQGRGVAEFRRDVTGGLERLRERRDFLIRAIHAKEIKA